MSTQSKVVVRPNRRKVLCVVHLQPPPQDIRQVDAAAAAIAMQFSVRQSGFCPTAAPSEDASRAAATSKGPMMHKLVYMTLRLLVAR